VKISARNVLPGIIRRIDMGAVNVQLAIEIAPGITIVSIVTGDSVKNLSLEVGKPAYAVIKASSVMVGVV
jgi:molybdopterin-binding protein